jgi:translation initiation factor 2 subunit 2
MSESLTIDDLDLDLDFSKKKKKKKVQIVIDGSEPVTPKQLVKASDASIAFSNALTTMAEAQAVALEARAMAQVAEAVAQTAEAMAMAMSDDLETIMDFTKKKKKKKVLQLNDIDESADYKENDNKLIIDSQQQQEPRDVDTEDIPYEVMLQRLYQQLHDDNPTLASRDHLNKKVKPPTITRLGTTRSCWSNFKSCCDSLQRESDHVQNFFLSELGATGSIDGDFRLIIKSKIISKTMEGLLRKYIDQYVRCYMCKSMDTYLERDQLTRLHFLKCRICTSQRSVLQIKHGYQATTKSDRKNERQDD